MQEQPPYFSIRNLKMYFPFETTFWGRPKNHLKAIDDVSFDIEKGRTIALVGESGSGKTTLGRTILRLQKRTAGDIKWNGKGIDGLKGKELLSFRKQNQIIFQDPTNSLNPSQRIYEILSQGLDLHFEFPYEEKKKRIKDMLSKVGLGGAYNKYPHEFSGGQRQRIMIAKVILLDPNFIVCDEPVASLDVSIQAQILLLLKELQREYKLSYLFISHNLGIVRQIADEVVVMYLGEVVERGTNDEIFQKPSHPYTQSLIDAIPKFKEGHKRTPLEGDIPSPINKPSGCPFRTRCPIAQEKCALEKPSFKKLSKTHYSACHFS